MMRIERRVKKFFIAGLAAALVNFSSLAFFVEVLGFRAYLLKNAANLLAMEIAVVFHFFLSREWTWEEIPRKKGGGLLAQALSFHIAVFAGIVLRTILFAILEKSGVHYLLNVALGIGLVAALNFVLCDKFVFKGTDDHPCHRR